MVENLPVHSLQHKALTIEGYSRAAVQTYWRIPELKLGFDLGASPWSFMGTQTFFVTHAHLDHLAALPVYVARRRMMKMEPPTIYLPAEVVDTAHKLLMVWQKLDRGRMNCELVGVQPGDEIELSREHVVTVTRTKHTVPSVGYLVWDRRKIEGCGRRLGLGWQAPRSPTGCGRRCRGATYRICAPEGAYAQAIEAAARAIRGASAARRDERAGPEKSPNSRPRMLG